MLINAEVGNNLVFCRYLNVIGWFELPVFHTVFFHPHKGRVVVRLGVTVAFIQNIQFFFIFLQLGQKFIFQFPAGFLYRSRGELRQTGSQTRQTFPEFCTAYSAEFTLQSGSIISCDCLFDQVKHFTDLISKRSRLTGVNMPLGLIMYRKQLFITVKIPF